MTHTDYLSLIRETILNPETFVRATFSGRQKGQSLRWQRITIRPVLLKNKRHLQFSYYDEAQHIAQNHAGEQAAAELENTLKLPFRNFHIQTTQQYIQINLTKKGTPIISIQNVDEPQPIDLAHDREKQHILMEGQVIPYLLATGIITADGRVKAAMRNKFAQINQFLQRLQETGELKQLAAPPIEIVDFGCGSAVLTFATYHYITEILNIPVHVVGVDIKKHLIEKHRETAKALGWAGIEFHHSTIADYQAEKPVDIVIALHACDTATDDAIAQGIRWGSKLIVCAPCCHHDLQAQLSRQTIPAPFEPVLRYGLFHERIGDVLTDTFRTLILRMAGYKTDVVQFVAPEHTPKNIMIRAVKTADHGSSDTTREYESLCQYWQVTPYLQQILDETHRL